MMQSPNQFRKSNHCPFCRYFTNAASNPDNESELPIPGALSVCIKCAKVSIFNDDMSLEKFDMNQLSEEDHAHVIRLQYHIHGILGRYSEKH